ncbi:hypothetical protein ACJ41O_007882 [Fusarium nematophilum]
MAQGHVVQGPLAGESLLSGLADGQRHRVQQYEKIVRFQEAVLSGKHPSIKLSPNLIASTQSSTHLIDATIKGGASDHRPEPSQYSVGAFQQPGHSARSGPPAVASTTPTVGKPYGSGSTEINPIFLEKSDDLVKAELQLQRQRLERALRDEVDQRRTASKNAAQGEPMPEFDLNDVLSKALTLVQATAGPVAADENLPATNLETASDSFDDNTFYSSQHNTPSSVLTSRVRNESEEARVPEALESQPPTGSRNVTISRTNPAEPEPLNLDSTTSRSYQAFLNQNPDTGSSTLHNTSRGRQVPGLNAYAEDKAASGQDTSAGQSHSEGSSNVEVDQHRDHFGSTALHQPREHYIDSHPPSPLMRAHERSPRLAQASQLTTARRPPPAAEATSNSSTGTPAQVANLRNEPIAVTSPESSPQGGIASEKRKGKKKKRKADRQAPEAEAAPYIKPEPRSPSPMNAPSYIRPNKRQRYSQRQPDETGYEVRYEPQRGDFPPDHLAGRLERDDRVPIGYERSGGSSQRAASSAVPGGPIYRREYADDRFISGDPYAVEQHPRVSAHHQGQASIGRASSQTRPSDGYQRPSWSYQGAYEPSSVAVRSDGDAYMTAPRPPPTRIIVDAFGREYIEPPRPTIIRHSVAPPPRSGETEIIYERAAPRAISRHTGIETFEEGGTVYRRPSPTYTPRRVVTQPEFISQDYRDQRPRDYSTRPMAPPGEFVEVMAPPERRRVEEGPREYITRAASVRPAEPLRYEVARDYGRLQSVRPEAPVRQYATSVHPESGREAAQPYAREYGTLPVEQGAVRREYSSRPVERYYNQPVRGGEEIAFIERPRGTTQEIVYADDARREVYR